MINDANWRTLFSEEVSPEEAVHVYGRGEIGEAALAALENWVGRARKRLESRAAESAPQADAQGPAA